MSLFTLALAICFYSSNTASASTSLFAQNHQSTIYLNCWCCEPFRSLLTKNCSAASPAPEPTSGDIVPPPYVPCYTATVTRPVPCPLIPDCVEPDCIILETTTAPCPPPHCSVTPTVTVGASCPTGCHVGCETAWRTVTASDCPVVYNN